MELTNPLFRQVVDQLEDGVYVVDRERRIQSWNRAAERIAGYRAEGVLGRPCFADILQHVDDAGTRLCQSACPLLETMRDGEARSERIFLHHADGHRVPVLVKASPLRDEAGELVGAVEVFEDDQQRMADLQRIDELERQALLDPLTGVGNRRYIERTLRSRLAELERHGQPFGLLFVDIDRFKAVNDEHGHAVGDQVLVTVARTLAANLRSYDFLGRWGGEELLVVLGRVATGAEVRASAERLRMLIGSSGIRVRKRRLRVTASFGATVARAGDTFESVVGRADALMYRSKEDGRDRVTCDVE